MIYRTKRNGTLKNQQIFSAGVKAKANAAGKVLVLRKYFGNTTVTEPFSINH